jgi:predicted metal-dependent hydrolase
VEYDPRYLQGIELFNQCEFFEAHEVWEDLWSETQGPSRRYFQGLIQVAVCLHHFGNGNLRGARKLYHSSRGYLTEYEPWHLGLNVSAFLEQLTVCCSELLAEAAVEAEIELIPDTIPEIHLEQVDRPGLS